MLVERLECGYEFLKLPMFKEEVGVETTHYYYVLVCFVQASQFFEKLLGLWFSRKAFFAATRHHYDEHIR